MKNLKTELNRYIKQVRLNSVELGPTSMTRTATESTLNQSTNLKIELQKIRKSKDQGFALCVGMVALSFLISIGIVINFLHDPNQIAALFSATGLTTAGLISVMRSLWKEKVSIDLVIALLENMKPESFESIIPVILQRL